ncbi:uncharacterized protein TRIVIDRAFT_228447 [Trichoderma virens Gv29-8]|uniref:Uncharacterized protein n=1 Tax=Hypocrea virens (strain Gv29-8 / FGSC 10586) TaxID=413071 RepID=G9NCJ3_HYPVG|nr:uncharacterized protein TRIVIDRAFT_228447 [Trichoderma virens Gv29-8]EHK15417.1 hypothetical protein TRIVIDRAFT_228447 [Trichoderma virens Gv29-8]
MRAVPLPRKMMTVIMVASRPLLANGTSYFVLANQRAFRATKSPGLVGAGYTNRQPGLRPLEEGKRRLERRLALFYPVDLETNWPWCGAMAKQKSGERVDR